MFKKYKFLVEKGISEMICSRIGEYILIYGGNNFPDGPPPENGKKIYGKMYLYDQNFNLIFSREGKIRPNAGIVISDENKIWYILDNSIYLMELKGQDIVESEFLKSDFNLFSGFGCKFGNDLIFGQKKLYKLSLKDKKFSRLSDFPAPARNQSVFCRYKHYLYVWGGASNICHMDGYKYDLIGNKWFKLADIPVSFTGSSSVLYDETRLLILGGFNKEVYDEAVQKLVDINYKKEYFSKKREDFLWNKRIFAYNFEQEEFLIAGSDPESALCGSGLIKIEKDFYLVGGELKPGFRNPYILKDSIAF